ncbi:MAG: tetratricopeptide repeat protein [Thermoleophilia bacterium]|nr:tetratricopeptide repeat protein [Thermoleophilia bacterium]
MTDTGDTTPEASDTRGEGARDRIPGRWIAITLAVIVVVGAGLGVLQTDAGVNESNTARETTRTAEAALRAGLLDSAARQLERDIRAESAAVLERQETVVRLAAAAGASAPRLSLDRLGGGSGADGGLPRARTARAARALKLDAERLRLTQGALAETRVTWNDRSTQYTTAISMLAVSLFLVGFSVALRGARRTLFYVLGVTFGLLVVGWAIHIRGLGVPQTADAAIAATAQGIVDSGEGRQAPAIAALTNAIEIDPDFAAPYSRRAAARFLQANPGYQQTGAVTGSDAALGEAVDDAERALELDGDRDFLAHSLIALLELHSADYGAAVAAADRAIAINPDVPDVRLLRSAALVGSGDPAAARASAVDARDLLSGSDPSERTRQLAAEYLTALEMVISDSPEHAGAARDLTLEMVRLETAFTGGREVSGTVPARGTATVDGLRYAGGRLRLRLRWSNLPPGTALTAIGFERPTTGGPWVQPPDLALFRTASASGQAQITVPLDRVCTPTRVRVDVFLDGAPAGSSTGPGGVPTC